MSRMIQNPFYDDFVESMEKVCKSYECSEYIIYYRRGCMSTKIGKIHFYIELIFKLAYSECETKKLEKIFH